jgi:uncharacterized protein (DUF2235 family)
LSKRLVICSDGTWNTPDQKDRGKYRPSNVVKMARAVAPVSKDGKIQIVFYDKGVGTGWGLDRLTGGAFGQGLNDNIKDAYRFLIHNYEEEDEIFFFGFSRGAYTVRSTAGFIRNSGLLKKIHADKIPEAVNLYRSREYAPASQEAKEFRKAYSREIRINFIGVWDTVGSLGIPIHGLKFLTRHKYQFHDVMLSSYVDNAFHALAVDEKRRPFKPTLWETKKLDYQRVEQVWFSGVHTNIGGGYEDSGLSDIAFTWMKEKAEECGLSFDQDYVKKTIDPNIKGELRNSKKGFFMLFPSYIRPIGQGKNSEESVSSTVEERVEVISSYRPENYLDYQEKLNDPENNVK